MHTLGVTVGWKNCQKRDQNMKLKRCAFLDQLLFGPGFKLTSVDGVCLILLLKMVSHDLASVHLNFCEYEDRSKWSRLICSSLLQRSITPLQRAAKFTAC